MKKTIILITVFFALTACTNEKTPENQTTKEPEKTNLEKTDKSSSEILPDSKDQLTIIADTITYTGLFKASTEDEALFMGDWVKNLKLEELTDIIFKAVYNGDLIAYGYGSEMQMSIEEVKELEAENSRKNIAKILFDESWYLDEKDMKLYKEVQAIMLAYERKNDEGIIKGYTAGIRIYFNKEKNVKKEQLQ